MGAFSCISAQKKTRNSRKDKKMPCTSCMTKYSRLNKEHGCSKCGYSFCERCLRQKCVIPSLSPNPVSVCVGCFNLLSKGESVLKREKSRDLPLPSQIPNIEQSNPWGDDRLPPPSLRSLYPQPPKPQIKVTRGKTERPSEWTDLEERLAQLSRPIESTVEAEKEKQQKSSKKPVASISELEERLAALRGLPVDIIRKPRLLVMNEDDDDDAALTDDAMELLRQVELGLNLDSRVAVGINNTSGPSNEPSNGRLQVRNEGMEDAQSTNSISSTMLGQVVNEALGAPSAGSSTSTLSRAASEQIYPDFAECVKKTLEDAKEAEREAMDYIARHEQPSQKNGRNDNIKFH